MTIIIVVAVGAVLGGLYAYYWKHNIYGGKFKDHFKDTDGE